MFNSQVGQFAPVPKAAMVVEQFYIYPFIVCITLFVIG